MDWLTTAEPPGKAVFYQKHMTHHLLPEIDRGWLDRVTNAFLIRAPGEVLTSLAIINFLFDAALVALLLHPMSREYQRIWFK